MIVVDTNIISEAMRPIPSQAVIDWLNNNDTASLFLTAVTIGEIEYVLRMLPPGKRLRELQETFERLVAEAFENRILVLDKSAAHIYGRLMAERRETGRPLGIPDGQIAAITFSKGFAIATRNTRDFEGCGIEIINPFTYLA